MVVAKEFQIAALVGDHRGDVALAELARRAGVLDEVMIAAVFAAEIFQFDFVREAAFVLRAEFEFGVGVFGDGAQVGVARAADGAEVVARRQIDFQIEVTGRLPRHGLGLVEQSRPPRAADRQQDQHDEGETDAERPMASKEWLHGIFSYPRLTDFRAGIKSGSREVGILDFLW